MVKRYSEHCRHIDHIVIFYVRPITFTKQPFEIVLTDTCHIYNRGIKEKQKSGLCPRYNCGVYNLEKKKLKMAFGVL